jgi:DNA primase
MNVFETLRERVPIEEAVGRVTEMAGRKARCVAHDDEHPSMHVYDRHIHCYGCGFHGDVVTLWSAATGTERPIDAAFDLAREFNIQLPVLSEEARQKHEERRQAEQDHLEEARARHAGLEKHSKVAKWWEGRGFTDELRQKFLLGSNKDGTEAVIPFWRRGRVVGLIRRKLEGEPKYILPEKAEFPEGHRPLFIPGSTGTEVYLVEGFIDALGVAASGKSVIAVGGTGISRDQVEELGTTLLPDDVKKIYILPDDDAQGREAGREWALLFFPKGSVCPANYGEGAKDIADTFAREGAEKTGEHLARLASASKDMIDIETEEAAKIEGGPREKLAYATKHIVPLLASITPDGMQDATADIVVEQVKGLKKNWLTKAIKDENERQFRKHLEALQREAQAKTERQAEEYRQRIAEAQEEIDALFKPGVLTKLRSTAAAMHNVYGDKEPLELALLVALGAQLEPLPNGRPLGASILLTAEAGRGKNHIVDAAVKPLPPEFYFAFEISSGQAPYYKALEDPDFFRHTFCYPNEIEGAEDLWEFLRPMLSKGVATKIVTIKVSEGPPQTVTIHAEGPVTIAIPTIRNKTDEQLQTRLLVAELPDYPGRVKHHSAAISEQLLPDSVVADYSRERWLWQEGLRQLTERRRVVFPLAHPDFALDDDKLSHGARLWTNLLSLMATNAWLEQRNRRLIELSSGEAAIEATPEDYGTAYRIFTKVCKRTVVSLSDVHRSILDAIYDLQQDDPSSDGFSQRKIAEKAGVSQGTVSNNRTFLVMSAKLLRETEYGLTLVADAEPSWWEGGDQLMVGLPTPEQVWTWWGNQDPPPDGANHPNRTNRPQARDEKSHTDAALGDNEATNHGLITPETSSETANRDQRVINEQLFAGNGLSKRNAGEMDVAINPIRGLWENGDGPRPPRRLTTEEVQRVRQLVRQGMRPEIAREEVLKKRNELDKGES